MDNILRRPQPSDEGIHEPCTSMEALPFKDLERQLSHLWDDFCDGYESTSSGSPTGLLRNLLIEDKANYFQQVSSCIEEKKNSFLEFDERVSQRIDDVTWQIISCVEERQRELKTQLNHIKMEKVSKWDRQLNRCRKALARLQMFERGTCSNAEIFDPYWDEELTRELELVDERDVKFEIDNYQTILHKVKNLGTLTHQNQSKGNVGEVSVKPKFVFGGSGDEPGQFCRPWGVCSDATGRILVCDRSNHRIQIFNECGNFLIQFGKEGAKAGEFNRPSGIDVDNKCRIIVADKDNHRIQVFTYSGNYLFGFGGQGTKPGQFLYPWDVSANQNCDVAVSDTKNHRIQLFNEKGRFITLLNAETLGYANPRLGLRRFDSPRGLAFRSDGNLLVTDFNNHRILLVNKHFSKVQTFGSEGFNFGQFFRPQGIACDPSGRFAIADSKNYRVQIFDSCGNHLMSFGTQGNEPGQFDCPQGICFHPNRSIVVVDFNNNRVQVF